MYWEAEFVSSSKSNNILEYFCILCLCIILRNTSKASEKLTFILIMKQILILLSDREIEKEEISNKN